MRFGFIENNTTLKFHKYLKFTLPTREKDAAYRKNSLRELDNKLQPKS